MTPRASVVVASFSGEEPLRRCFESLKPLGPDVEIVVATDAGAGVVERLVHDCPAAVFVRAPAGTNVFRLRAQGVDAASGRFVALTEDHCEVVPGWLESLLECLEAGHSIVGGPVEAGLDQRTYDRALYLCEYGLHMPPLSDGPVSSLSGLNVAYPRERLLACRSTWHEAFYEPEVHEALRAAGCELHRVARAGVKTFLRMPLAVAIPHLFRGGLRYGGRRRLRVPEWTRPMLALGAPALPTLLLWRIARATLGRRRERLAWIGSGLPYMVLLLGAWSGGEAAGYLSAARGNSRAEPPQGA